MAPNRSRILLINDRLGNPGQQAPVHIQPRRRRVRNQQDHRACQTLHNSLARRRSHSAGGRDGLGAGPR